MKISHVEASFSDERSIYFAGQTVSGVLKFRVSEEFAVSGIVLKCKGKSHVKWEEDNIVDDDKYIHYDELYMKDKICLLGSEDSKDYKEDLHVGEHTHNFSFKLREDLPTSFESKHAYVRYCVVLKFYRTGWKKDYEFKQPFTVLSVIDLNSIPDALKPVNSTDTDTIGCCCCEEGPVRSEFKIGRSGYVPGESIVINAEIDNRTSKEMNETRVELWMKLKLKADSERKIKKTKLAELKHGPTRPGGQDIWSQERLQIPPCPPTMLEFCTIIELTYYLHFVGDIGFLGVLHEVPILIGSVPLKNIYSMPDNWGFMPAPSLSALPPLSTPAVVDPADISFSPITTQPGALPSAPPPSYEESLEFTGTIVTEKVEGNKKEKDFKPTYIYYNFGPNSFTM
ncbi:arrestin domain-containing protein 3-like [Ostrea edulis]|uniref:arrestin domain-containing protein 3-like n=1 Tax=Ostrea edulis TaxID=37623 RepID=UPI0024AFCD62|nr:arrestin domain-containing protein 3-like [Ostrea edulis]